MKKLLTRGVMLGAFLYMGAGGAGGQDLPFVRGEVNLDGTIDIGDPLAILFYLAGRSGVPCEKAADVNDSGAIDLSDVIYAIEFLFRNGPLPAAPSTSPARSSCRRQAAGRSESTATTGFV